MWIRAERAFHPSIAIVCALGFALGLLIAPRAFSVQRSVAFLVGLSANSPTPAAAPEVAVVQRDASAVTDLRIDGGDTRIPARLYVPPRGSGPAIVVAHGIHHAGIDEPRLVHFCRQLVDAGFVVLTPQLTELASYRISEGNLASLERAVHFLATEPRNQWGSQVGLVGFSFSGGLSLLAATRPNVSEHLRFVFSIGGYHDLDRVLRSYATEIVDTPSGPKRVQPHDYGLVVLAYNLVARLVPVQDVAATREALLSWLKEDREQARAFASQVTSPEAEHLFELLERQELRHLTDWEALLDDQWEHSTLLSPRDHMAEIPVPVYLLHGSGDTVVSPSEAVWASMELGEREHSMLVTPLVSHAALDGQTGIAEQVQLVLFMSDIL